MLSILNYLCLPIASKLIKQGSKNSRTSELLSSSQEWAPGRGAALEARTASPAFSSALDQTCLLRLSMKCARRGCHRPVAVLSV